MRDWQKYLVKTYVKQRARWARKTISNKKVFFLSSPTLSLSLLCVSLSHLEYLAPFSSKKSDISVKSSTPYTSNLCPRMCVRHRVLFALFECHKTQKRKKFDSEKLRRNCSKNATETPIKKGFRERLAATTYINTAVFVLQATKWL